ncbi:MAG TPA: TPM domain-containing protein [Burkholderiales bacterium]|nr:TPM domain-containing protein [Burkholderiales bacterium]
MRRFLASVAAALLLIFGLEAGADDAPVPALTGRVVDVTGTLTAGQKGDLEAKLAGFEQRKGSQIAVLIVGTTFPEPIEAYSIRVAEAWKIGRKAVDDGVLVVIARSDRAMRLEVGYGLEGAVPDAVAKRLIEESFTPRFREDDIYEGLNQGVDQLIRVIDGEPLPAPAQSVSGPVVRSIETYFVLFLVIVFAVGGVLRAVLGRFPAAALIGAGTGAIAWFTAAPIFIAVLIGIVGFFLTLLGGGTGGLPRGGRGGWGGGGGFGGGGFGGGGGFSGGGGGFGGGGASGRW